MDGIIISSQQLQESDIKKIKLNNIAIVTIDRFTSSKLCSSVSIKNKKGGQDAARYLFKKGCEKIAHLRGPTNINTANERFEGFKDVIRILNSDFDVISEVADFNVQSGYEGMSNLLTKYKGIDGVFASNDLIAFGAVKSARELGYIIPNDLLIIGFDGIDMTGLFHPTVSTLQQPVNQMGIQAVKEVISFINNPKEKITNYSFETKLIGRESTKD